MVHARKERRRRKKRKEKEMKNEMSGLEFPKKNKGGITKIYEITKLPLTTNIGYYNK